MLTAGSLSEAELDRVCVVLVRARNPNNIGAVARAMHDFGFGRLRVVNEFTVPFEAARSAVDASDVLANAVACAIGRRVVQLPLVPERIKSALDSDAGKGGVN